MRQADLADAISSWFARTGRASMVLPDGWFGRPYDNMHSLTYVEARPHKVIMELDEQVYLVFTELGEVANIKGTLQLGGFRQLVFDRQGYGDLEPHAGVYREGVVEFVPPLGKSYCLPDGQ